MSVESLLWGLAVVALGLACASPVLRRHAPAWHWYLIGFPCTALRVWVTWRRVAILNDLTMTRKPARGLLGDLVVKGDPLRPIPPRIGLPTPVRGGLTLAVRLHPGQTPALFLAAAEALVHAWRVHAVRVTSLRRGQVILTAQAVDPLATEARVPSRAVVLLSALVGAVEDGNPWVIDLRRVPHWLIVGATRSGKSTLLASLVCQLAPQPVALVGIDCKGGMELSLFGPRLSALTTNRKQAAALLAALVALTEERMLDCRAAGARSIWELEESLRPVPVVVLVDELAELYLGASREDKQEAAQCATALLRLAQLGAALGVHLVAAGQRVGSDLGPGVTALRAQLAGRVCHRVNDPETAVMTLGDLNPDAVAVAQAITADQAGVAVTTGEDGSWLRARSTLTTTEEATRTATRYAHLTPELPELVRALEGGDR